MKINSITDLIDLLQKIGEPESGHSRFFRGHADQKWEIEPSIYRVPEEVEGKPKEKPLIQNEENIIRDAVVNSPDDFSDQDSIFSMLVKLQHYGYPTRLLDLTTNALVALYFAVKLSDSNKDKDGELLIFDIPDTEVKYFDSDTVSILAALSLRKANFRIDGYISISKINSIIHKADEFVRSLKLNSLLLTAEDENKIREALNYYVNDLMINQSTIMFDDKINDFEFSLNELITKYDINNIKQASLNEISKKAFIESFNKQPDIARLLHDIRKDKPSFLPVIESEDLKRVICVKPKLDNNRIIRQQGCFLLFGINTFKINKAILDEKWLKKDNEGNNIIIPKDSKQKILDELKVFGISEKTLFPELESQAKEILDKYKY